MTPAEACVKARALLDEAVAAGANDFVEIPWEINYALQGIDPKAVSDRDKWLRYFDFVVLRDMLNRMEGKVVKEVTKTLVGTNNGAANGME